MPCTVQIQPALGCSPRVLLPIHPNRPAMPRLHTLPYGASSKAFKAFIPLPSQFVGIRFPLVVLFIWIHIETLRVAIPSNGRYNWSSLSSIVYVFPINALEERMVLDTRCAPRDVAESFGSVGRQKGADEITCWFGERWTCGEVNGLRYDPRKVSLWFCYEMGKI